MASKPRRQNGEVAMNNEITEADLQKCMFLSSVMTGLTLMIRSSTFTKNALDEAFEFMGDAEKAKFTGATDNIERAHLLLSSALIDLSLITSGVESDDEADGDAE